MVSTADVRPVEDVIDELRKLLVKKLPGSQAIHAAWGTVNRAAELIKMAKAIINEDEPTPTRRHEQYGQIYAATTIVREVADAFRVSNFKPGTVF